MQFPYHDTIGSLVLSHDAGWQNENGSWFKGYKHTQSAHGSWVAISTDQNQVLVKHDGYRSFPLRWHNQCLTNMPGAGEKIWSDDVVCLQDNQLILTKTDIIGSFEHTALTVESALNTIVNNLQYKADRLQNDLQHWPKKSICVRWH